MDKEELFADETVLLDCCRIHATLHEYSVKVIRETDENDVDLVVTEAAQEGYKTKVNNLLQMYAFIFKKSFEINEKSEEEETAVRQISQKILDYDKLDGNTPEGMNPNYKEEIDELDDLLDELGPDDFITLIDTLMQEINSLKSSIERKWIDERLYDFDRESSEMFWVKIDGIVNSDLRTNVIVEVAKAHHFEERGDTLLIRSSDPAVENKDKVVSALKYSSGLNICSPKELVETAVH
jgi:hypothetical protein